MKKSISVILCLSLVLCSLFSIGSVAFAAEASVAKNLLSVKTDGVINDTITYTVYLNPGVNIAGATVWAAYDPNVLEVVSAGQAQGSPISGYYTEGPVDGKSDTYTVAYFNAGEYKNGATEKTFIQFTFRVKGEARPYTSVSIRCREFVSDSQHQNNISQYDDYEPFYIWSGTTLSTTHLLSAAMFEGGVTVEWEPTVGATGYVVYKIINGAWTEIARTTETSYIDYDVENNNVYQYTVRAYNANGLNSSFEPGVSVCYLLAPSFLTLTPSGNNVMASWTAADGVNTYNIYRRTINVDGSKGAWTLVGTTNKTSFVDSTSTVNNWNNYEYAVCSVSGSNESPKYTISQVSTNAKPYINLAQGSDGIWYCYINGAVNYDYSGIASYNGEWFYVKNGVIDWSYTGLTSYYGTWFYVVGGYLDWSQTTLVNYEGVWYYVENGTINWNSDTLVNYWGEWFYTKNGVLASDYTGLVNYWGEWFYVVNGYLDWNQTTLVEQWGTWFYVVGGHLDWNQTTLVNYNGEWLYVENGIVNWNSDTLVNFGGEWYYAKDGKLASDYTGLVNYYGEWFYVVNGHLDWNQTTLVEQWGTWFYVVGGHLDWNQTTLVNYNGEWFYVENGIVNWNSDTLVNFGGEWYYAKDGKLASDYTGLMWCWDTWFYVVNGHLDWSQNTVVQYGDAMFYVENGMINWGYSGVFTQNNVKYQIDSGLVVGVLAA